MAERFAPGLVLWGPPAWRHALRDASERGKWERATALARAYKMLRNFGPVGKAPRWRGLGCDVLLYGRLTIPAALAAAAAVAKGLSVLVAEAAGEDPAAHGLWLNGTMRRAAQRLMALPLLGPLPSPAAGETGPAYERRIALVWLERLAQRPGVRLALTAERVEARLRRVDAEPLVVTLRAAGAGAGAVPGLARLTVRRPAAAIACIFTQRCLLLSDAPGFATRAAVPTAQGFELASADSRLAALGSAALRPAHRRAMLRRVLQDVVDAQAAGDGLMPGPAPRHGLRGRVHL